AQLVNVAIAFSPDRDRLGHISEMTKTPKEHRHALDIAGVVASLHKALTHQLHIWRGREQWLPGDPVALGYSDLSQVLVVFALGVSGRVFSKTEDCFFFRLRPKALTTYIGAN